MSNRRSNRGRQSNPTTQEKIKTNRCQEARIRSQKAKGNERDTAKPKR